MNFDHETEETFRGWFGPRRSWPATLSREREQTFRIVANAAAKSRRLADGRLHLHLLHLDLSISIYVKLLLLAEEIANGAGPVLAWECPDGGPKPEPTLSGAFATCANTLLALRLLVMNGLATQARLLLRSHVELSDLLVAALGDSEFFGRYMKWPGGLDREMNAYWRKYVAPAHVRHVRANLLRDMSVPGQVVEHRTEFDRTRYTQLSAYHHAHPIALCVGSHEGEFDTDRIRTSLGGSVGRWMEGVLDDVTDCNFMSLNVMMKLLFTKHGWEQALQSIHRDARGSTRDLIRLFLLEKMTFSKLSLVIHPTAKKRRTRQSALPKAPVKRGPATRT